MLLLHVILLLLFYSIWDVDCQENLSDSIATFNSETKNWNGALTKFGNQLDGIIKNMNEQPASANDLAFSNEMKQDYDENLELKIATTHSISLLRYSLVASKMVDGILNKIRTLDMLLSLIGSNLDQIATKWFQKQRYLPTNENEDVYFLLNGRVLRIKYSTEKQWKFFLSMKRAKKRTTDLQEYLNQLQRLILLRDDLKLHGVGHLQN
ncbi:unnamed protein product [Fasciola hepatica]|uniref:Uncharacterized protein n=1 Tax=Fasciola hepatica TaxID=6192 RepID=A0ABC9HEZ3_FASHE